jgi:hypothetical protein
MKPVKPVFGIISTILLCLCCNAGYAQSLPKKEVQLAIGKMSSLLEENYVFADKGKAIAAHLRKQFQEGKFAQAGTWKELDSLVTRALREFSKDGHLYVSYDPKMVQELSVGEEKKAAPENFSFDPFYYGKDAIENNFGFKEVKMLEGNIGYIRLAEINLSEKSLSVLFAAMQFVANTRALVIDLQNNGGGGSVVGNVFESFFLPKETPLLEFKTRRRGVTLAKTEAWLLEKKYEKPLYILVNGGTASAAEAFAYALQRHGRAKVVGQRSAGGAHMNTWYVVNEHIYLSVSTGAPTWPGTEESWEQKGIQPDHPVAVGEEIKTVKRMVEEMASSH